MMKKMGYNQKHGLKFDKGRRNILRSFVPKVKGRDYYLKT